MSVTARRKDLLSFGTPIFFKDEKDSDPGVLKEILLSTIQTKKIYLAQVFANAGQQGKISVWQRPVGGSGPTDVLLGDGRISEAKPNFYFSWGPLVPILAGERVIVKFDALAGRPVTNVSAFIQAALP